MQPILAMPRPNRTEVVIDVAGVTLILSTAELDALLSKLGDARASMRPPQQAEPDPTEPFAAVEPQRFFVSAEIVTGAVLIQLPHPGFGWLAWELQRDRARELLGMLTKELKPADG